MRKERESRERKGAVTHCDSDVRKKKKNRNEEEEEKIGCHFLWAFRVFFILF